MQESITVCYVLNKRLKALVQEWAEGNDRTASAELRQILEQEAQRREQAAKSAEKAKRQ
jgi:hypothetical protein